MTSTEDRNPRTFPLDMVTRVTRGSWSSVQFDCLQFENGYWWRLVLLVWLASPGEVWQLKQRDRSLLSIRHAEGGFVFAVTLQKAVSYPTVIRRRVKSPVSNEPVCLYGWIGGWGLWASLSLSLSLEKVLDYTRRKIWHRSAFYFIFRNLSIVTNTAN